MPQSTPPLGMKDLGDQRQRLVHQLKGEVFWDPEILSQLGRVCFEMSDLFHAGRYWFLSNEEGEDVERVVDYFILRCNSNPTGMLIQLPNCVVLKQVDDYSGPALIRLRKCGVTNDHLARRLKRALRFRRASVKSKRSKFVEMMSVCLFGLFVISLCVGFFTLIRWIIDLIRSIA